MSNSTINIKEIEKLVISGLIWGYLPIYILALGEPLIENIQGLKLITVLFNVFAVFSFFYGHVIFGSAANKYARYKGYKNHLYI